MREGLDGAMASTAFFRIVCRMKAGEADDASLFSIYIFPFILSFAFPFARFSTFSLLHFL